MLDREELAARILIAEINGTELKDIDVQACFTLSDKFLAYAAKRREPKACEHKDVTIYQSPVGESLRVCLGCGMRIEPPKPACEPDCEHKWVSDGGECYYCHTCGVPKVLVGKRAPKPERVAKRLQVGSLVRVFDRYRLAVPCIGTIIKTEGVVQGCLVQLENGSHGRAEERYPDGIHVCFEQLREILPGDEK